jgi:hypothetical protein
MDQNSSENPNIFTNKAMAIIFGIILFFVFIGFLAFGASDGNRASEIILNILGFSFLFAISVQFPAWAFSKVIPAKYLFGKPKTALAVFFIIFWIIVFSVVFFKPEWGWKYTNFIGIVSGVDRNE